MGIYWFIIFLGIIQGLTEFLPISSSGHLAFFQNLEFFKTQTMELEKNFTLLQFNIFLHFGTLIAVLVYWRKDILELILGFFSSLKQKDFGEKRFKISMSVFWGTLPVLAVPFYKDFVEQSANSLYFIAFFFIVNGIFLSVTDLIIVKKNSERNSQNIEDMKIPSLLIIGLFQIFAVFPGISRSGSTIASGLIMKLKGEEAIRYSFFLSIPVLIAANLLEMSHLSAMKVQWDYLIIGMGSSFLAGMFSIRVLLWMGKKMIIYPFGFYTLLLGLWILFVYL